MSNPMNKWIKTQLWSVFRVSYTVAGNTSLATQCNVKEDGFSTGVRFQRAHIGKHFPHFTLLPNVAILLKYTHFNKNVFLMLKLFLCQKRHCYIWLLYLICFVIFVLNSLLMLKVMDMHIILGHFAVILPRRSGMSSTIILLYKLKYQFSNCYYPLSYLLR